MTLRSLTLADIRVTEPMFEDEPDVLDGAATWARACAKIAEGHPAADVAALLLELSDDEMRDLRAFWTGEDDPDPSARAWTLADMGKPEFLLSAALNVAGADWPMPLMEADEVIALQAENAKLRELLAIAGAFMEGFDGDECQSDEFPAQLARVREALGTGGAR